MSVGHTTIMADLDFFGMPAPDHEQPPQPDALAAALQRLGQLTLQVHLTDLVSFYTYS